MQTVCNICGSIEFNPFGTIPRANAECISCGSLERHRALHYLLSTKNFLENRLGAIRCLHLAPERVTSDYLVKAFGAGYISADLSPQQYKYAKCIKLKLPEDLAIFPDEYFDLIVHNHVLEHIPGSFRLHIDEFYRILSEDGVMVFTIPEYKITRGVRQTIEFGENLPTDQDRLREHGQRDHYKTFGTDLIEYLQTKFSKFEAMLLDDSELVRSLRTNHNAWGVVFWCAK